jgi:hypothetical protein
VLLIPGEDQLFENVVAHCAAILEDWHNGKMEKSSKKDILPGMNAQRGGARLAGTRVSQAARRSRDGKTAHGAAKADLLALASRQCTREQRKGASPPSGFCFLFLWFRGYRLEVLCLENFFTVEAFDVVHIAISGNDFGARVLAVRLHIDGLSFPIKCGCYEEVVASSMRDEHTDRPYFIHPFLIVKRNGFEKMHPKPPARQN